MLRRLALSTLFPYTTLFRSLASSDTDVLDRALHRRGLPAVGAVAASTDRAHHQRSEEHTSELQSRGHLVCRLLLEKKNATNQHVVTMHCYLHHTTHGAVRAR